MKFQTLSLLVCLLWCRPTLAQETWRIAYGAYGPEEGRSVKVVSDGNIVVAGSTGSFGSGASDIYMLKIDPSGVVLWSRTIGGAMIEQANDLVQLSDGGWLVIGSTNSSGGEGGYDGLLVRTDAEGQVLWERQYGGADWDFFHSGIRRDDGSFLMVGQTFSYGSGGDVWLVCTDQQGDTLWTKHFGEEGLDDGQALVTTPDGGLALAGSSLSMNGNENALVVKLNDQFNVEWSNTFGGDSLDIARDIVTTLDGGFSVVGVTRSYSSFAEHYHFKLDQAGYMQWYKHWGQVNDQEAYRHVELPSGRFATVGWSKTSGGGGKDMFILLSDPLGEFLEQHTFGGVEDDEGYSIAPSTDGFLLCGATLSYGAGGKDVFVVRTDTSGNTETEYVSSFFDPLVIGRNPSVAEHTPYPNPSTGLVNIPPSLMNRRIEIMDATGRTMNVWETATSKIDLGTLGCGVYFLKVFEPGNHQVRTFKLLLTKP